MIEPKIPKDVVLSTEDCIFILENLKGRTKFYDKQFNYMGKEYCEDLAGLEILAIDTIIKKLQNCANDNFIIFLRNGKLCFKQLTREQMDMFIALLNVFPDTSEEKNGGMYDRTRT